MKYLSTRGSAPVLEFDDVLLTGLARDGGLYLPADWPVFSAREITAFAGLSYAELAERVIRPFVAGSVVEAALPELIEETYAGFGHAAVAPLKQLESGLWLLELFHGPTLAFKDYPLQLVGRLFDRVLKARNQRVTIVGATSGDKIAAERMGRGFYLKVNGERLKTPKHLPYYFQGKKADMIQMYIDKFKGIMPDGQLFVFGTETGGGKDSTFFGSIATDALTAKVVNWPP